MASYCEFGSRSARWSDAPRVPLLSFWRRSKRMAHPYLASILATSLATFTLAVLPAHIAGANTLSVTNCNDSGTGSLRQAVLDANSGDIIDFALSPPCSTVTLTSVAIEIATSLTITGPGSSSLDVNGNNASGVFQVDSGVTAAISGLAIEDGSASAGGGIDNAGTLTVTDSTVSGNTATIGDGGGIDNAGTLTVTDSTLSGNTATIGDGGGIDNAGTLTVTDSTLSGNSAGSLGGGIDNAGTLTVTDSTLSGNSAVDAAGVATSGNLSLGATIVANSTSGGDCYGTPSDDLGYNLDDDGTCRFSTTNHDLPNTNPLLDPSGLQDNGGPTQTIALESGSPAIAKVTASLCSATDQRGVTRIDPCDIGAYETNTVLVQTITFASTPPSNATMGGPTYTVTATGGDSGNPITFSIDPSATSVCSITGSVVSYIGVGICTIDANQAGNARYTVASQVQQSFRVGQASQTITFTSKPPSNAKVGAAYKLAAVGGASGNPVIFSSDTPACKVTGSTAEIVAGGTCIIDANEAGNANYSAAPVAQQSFTVLPGSQTIKFISTPPVLPTVGGRYRLRAIGGASGKPVIFSSDTPTVCEVSASMVSIVGAGTCTIDANEAGNASYSAAPQVQQSFDIAQRAQTITFTSTPPSKAKVGGRYNVTAFGGSSDNPVIFSIDPPSTSVCSIAGSVVSFIGAGTCTIDANETGNASFFTAPQVQQVVTVLSSSQTITFTSTPPSNAIVGGRYKVTATGGASGKPVIFSSDSPTVCEVSALIVSTVGTGICTIDANEAGNTSYSAAPQVQQSFTVGRASQTITFTSTPPSPAIVGGRYTVRATGGHSDNPITFSIDPSATSVCSMTGSVVSFIGAGTCTIDANEAGNTSYSAAPQVQQVVTVGQAPTITTACPPTPPTVGQEYVCEIAATGSPTPALTVSQLPGWLVFKGSNSIGTVSGEPSQPGVFHFTITATNSAGKAHQRFQVTVVRSQSP